MVVGRQREAAPGPRGEIRHDEKSRRPQGPDTSGPPGHKTYPDVRAPGRDAGFSVDAVHTDREGPPQVVHAVAVLGARFDDVAAGLAVADHRASETNRGICQKATASVTGRLDIRRHVGRVGSVGGSARLLRPLPRRPLRFPLRPARVEGALTLHFPGQVCSASRSGRPLPPC